ncbi:MAG: prolipoprotein diacylglyceryl transferase [Prevotellaceae bacterium]|jgi:prolipoprotein diacylglyceryl transferase|nr:prolipoprotein diacylglyceryl transferase [Prevotellaceae bacterium]
MLGYITWNIDPVIFSFGPISLRWYGLMWGVGFLLGYDLIRRIFKNENKPDNWADKIFVYMFVGTIVGARIGHCFFYDWAYYSKHLFEVLFIWQGGLSSHGGALGILVAMYLFNRSVSKMGYLWIFDRLVMPVAVTAVCIRFGNLMNSEIYGEVTTLPWGFIFVRDGQTLPAHPTQIYEMLYCLIALAVTSYMYWVKKAYERRGLIFGTWLLIIFVSRFLLEFIKNNQEAFEDSMQLNMGQLLSIPFIVWGIWLLVKLPKRKHADK